MKQRNVGDVISFIGVNDLIYKGKITKIKGTSYHIEMIDNYYPYKDGLIVQEELVIKNNTSEIINLIKKYSNKATANVEHDCYNYFVEIVGDLWGLYEGKI